MNFLISLSSNCSSVTEQQTIAAQQRGCESERGLESKSGEGDESEKELQSLRAMEVGSDNELLCGCCVLVTGFVSCS